jgi:predicted Fe-Mo cluster-binding NifX family protein
MGSWKTSDMPGITEVHFSYPNIQNNCHDEQIKWEVFMKIVIPVDEKNAASSVCQSFGRAPYFLIFDSETKESTFIENSAAKSAGGAGIRAAQIVVDSEAEALLTPRLGENAFDVLKAADIKIYQSTNASVKENIDAFIDGKLSLLQEIHAGFHRHGDK